MDRSSDADGRRSARFRVRGLASAHAEQATQAKKAKTALTLTQQEVDSKAPVEHLDSPVSFDFLNLHNSALRVFCSTLADDFRQWRERWRSAVHRVGPPLQADLVAGGLAQSSALRDFLCRATIGPGGARAFPPHADYARAFGLHTAVLGNLAIIAHAKLSHQLTPTKFLQKTRYLAEPPSRPQWNHWMRYITDQLPELARERGKTAYVAARQQIAGRTRSGRKLPGLQEKYDELVGLLAMALVTVQAISLRRASGSAPSAAESELEALSRDLLRVARLPTIAEQVSTFLSPSPK